MVLVDSNGNSDPASLPEAGATQSLGQEPCCTGNMKVLAFTAALFIVITAAQACGAVAANSLTLLQDCFSMGVDAATYLGNILVEAVRGRRYHGCLEMLVAALSISMLVFFTLVLGLQALKNLQVFSSPENTGKQPDVNPHIVLAFALWGVVFDVASMVAFARNKSRIGEDMNLWTPLMHVGADFLRSMTTLLCSLAILVFETDGVRTDAWASLCVGATILAGSAVAVYVYCEALFQATLKCWRACDIAEASEWPAKKEADSKPSRASRLWHATRHRMLGRGFQPFDEVDCADSEVRGEHAQGSDSCALGGCCVDHVADVPKVIGFVSRGSVDAKLQNGPVVASSGTEAI